MVSMASRGEDALRGGEYVMCSKHNTRRIARYCVSVPVYNADHEVIGHTYECKASERCSSVPRQNESVMNERAKTIKVASSAPCAVDRPGVNVPRTDDADAASTSARGEESTLAVHCDYTKKNEAHDRLPETAVGPRSPTVKRENPVVNPKSVIRYYDVRAGLAERARAQRGDVRLGGEVKRLCWGCGLKGHEKTNCNNNLCRMCHRKCTMLSPAHDRNDLDNTLRHVCEQLPPSPFVLVTNNLPQTPDGMPACRCVVCGKYGHFDCRTAQVEPGKDSNQRGPPSTLSCSWCAMRGHHAFDCRARMRRVTDFWRQRIEHANCSAGLARSGAHNNSFSRDSNVASQNSYPSHRPSSYSYNASRASDRNDGYRGVGNAQRGTAFDGANYRWQPHNRSLGQGRQFSDRGAGGGAETARFHDRAPSRHDGVGSSDNRYGGASNGMRRGAQNVKRTRHDISGSYSARARDDGDEGDLF